MTANQTTTPQSLPRSAWGAPEISVSHQAGQWIIAGQKNRVILDESDLSLVVEAGPATWKMEPSSEEDMLVQWRDERFYLSLADAGKIAIEPYDTGYKTGVKIRLEQFRSTGLFSQGLGLDLAVVLTACLEGDDEELICDAVAIEREAALRQLDWPKAVDASDAAYTALPHFRGNLLPRDWPHDYHPFAQVPWRDTNELVDRRSVIRSGLIECWSMSWWGFQKGESAMTLIVETPADASYHFSHPAGGPTVIGPRWLASLGRFRHPRSVRMAFFPQGDYVTMAKRYRRHVQDTGQFVSLKEKIARSPQVAKLIGAAHIRPYAVLPKRSFQAIVGIDWDIYESTHEEPEEEDGYSVMSFDYIAGQLRAIKAMGFERLHVVLCGWPTHGYDTGHPDPLPPSPLAGGWEGLKRLEDAIAELGYTSSPDDQYRDYYLKAHSYDPQFAIHEEDAESQPLAFPGTRLRSGWKAGHLPMMNFWEGGPNAYLNARFALGHVKKNYQAMLAHGIRPSGIFFDVMGYVPPEEDFNPEHPTTRSENMAARAALFNWARNNLGIVGTEDGADWVVPYVDFGSVAGEGACDPAPLYNLVFHDAIMTPAGGLEDPLRCLLNAGFPQIDKNFEPEMTRTICALHERVGTLEMVGHEFLDDSYRKERSTFADGTTVTIDRDAETFEIEPPLEV
jgi:hypothetical protein